MSGFHRNRTLERVTLDAHPSSIALLSCGSSRGIAGDGGSGAPTSSTWRDPGRSAGSASLDGGVHEPGRIARRAAVAWRARRSVEGAPETEPPAIPGELAR